MTDKLSSTLNKMKTSHGSGHDGIASFYVKIALPVVGGSLCDLFNKSLFAGKFPEDWKIARIAPIFKGGAKDDRSNYLPISILPFISRLFEKLILNQFMNTWTQINHFTSISLVFDSYTRLPQPLWLAPIIGT